MDVKVSNFQTVQSLYCDFMLNVDLILVMFGFGEQWLVWR